MKMMSTDLSEPDAVDLDNLPPGICWEPYIGTFPCPTTIVTTTSPETTVPGTLPATGGGSAATGIMQGGVIALTLGILATAVARRRSWT